MKVCVGITGSIAAYRSPDFVKELVANGHEVRTILTKTAREFVTPKVLETFSQNAVLSHDSFDASHFATDHIAVARWANCFVIYGATADFLGRYANGLTGDFLTLQLLAFAGPVYLAPAMNPTMWNHPAVQENVRKLQTHGVRMIGPIAGTVSCGETGVGHIAEISEIIEAIGAKPPAQVLSGKTVLISAGPMKTSVDPVRYIQNRSSGRMGLELAKTAKSLGAHVQVILGPVSSEIEKDFQAFEIYRYSSPHDYVQHLEYLVPEADYFFSAAAVLDFEVLSHSKKIERSSLGNGSLQLSTQPVRDLVAAVASSKRSGQKIVAFAAEYGTNEEILKRAQDKMQAKGVDYLIANPVREGIGPEAEQNEIWVLKPGADPKHFGPALKSQIAGNIFDSILGSA